VAGALLNRHFRGKAFVRAFIAAAVHHPDGAVGPSPGKWMFDPTFSVLNWVLFKLASSPAG